MARLHAQLIDVAQALAAKRSLACEVVYVDDGSSDDTLAIARAAAGASARRPGDLVVAQFRQGSGVACRPRSCPAGRGAVHRRRRPASDRADRYAGRSLARWRLRRGLHRQGTSRERVGGAAHFGERLLSAGQLGRAHQDPGGCRRFSAALAARRRRLAPPARAQPLLQGTVELDRLSPDPHRLSAGSARRRPHQLELPLARSDCRSTD